MPIGTLYNRFARQGQEAARAAGKSLRIETSGESVELDASIIEQIVDPLLHLVQNAVVHGLEPPDERLMQEVETLLKSPDDTRERRHALISNIAAWAIEHPGVRVEESPVFATLLRRLRDAVFSERR